MPQTPYTAFHVDFSTLDIERGQVNLTPTAFTMVVQPQNSPSLFIPQLDDKQELQPSAKGKKTPLRRGAALRKQRG